MEELSDDQMDALVMFELLLRIANKLPTVLIINIAMLRNTLYKYYILLTLIIVSSQSYCTKPVTINQIFVEGKKVTTLERVDIADIEQHIQSYKNIKESLFNLNQNKHSELTYPKPAGIDDFPIIYNGKKVINSCKCTGIDHSVQHCYEMHLTNLKFIHHQVKHGHLTQTNIHCYRNALTFLNVVLQSALRL